MSDTRVILIGGTSHVGKSTLAATLAEELGWQLLSTDQLARHPGRPWGRELPGDVKAYFLSGSAEDLLGSVVAHYRNNVWPIVEAIIRSRVANNYDMPLVFEGSAILPESACALNMPGVQAVWLTAGHETISRRIVSNSDWQSASTEHQELINRFLGRSLLFDEFVRQSATENNCQLEDITNPDAASNFIATIGKR